MLTIVIKRFAQRLLSLALVISVVGGMALVAYFAPNLVEYFVSGSGSTATELDPVPPIVPAPAWP
jgi:hypothetical protein